MAHMRNPDRSPNGAEQGVTLSCRISRATYDHIQALCKELECTQSWLFREAVMCGLDQAVVKARMIAAEANGLKQSYNLEALQDLLAAETLPADARFVVVLPTKGE